MKAAVILFAVTPDQNDYFWPSYSITESGMMHDLILVHKDMTNVPDYAVNKDGMIIYEGTEDPGFLFDIYKEIYDEYKDDYDVFGFVTEKTILKRDGWLKKAVDMFSAYEGLGFVATQIFNANEGQYPLQSHVRTSAWFATSEALGKINWEMGPNPELVLADKFVEAGYFGAQVGNKVNVAFDALENTGSFSGDHAGSLMSKSLGCGLFNKVTPEKLKAINTFVLAKLGKKDDSLFIQSPFPNIGRRKIISQLQPFNGLIYDNSFHLVPRKYVEEHPYHIYTLINCIEDV